MKQETVTFKKPRYSVSAMQNSLKVASLDKQYLKSGLNVKM